MPDRNTSIAEEQALVERLRDGEEAAVEEVLRQYGGQLLTVAQRILHDEHLAQDALQDAFIMARRGLKSFDGRSRLGTWLYRIVVNAALMKIRKLSHKRERPAGEVLPEFLEDGHRANPGPAWRSAEKRLESEEARELVLLAIADLPEDHRNVLLLRDIEGLSTRDSAEVLGITSGNVKTRLHRARQALRELLDLHFREEAS